MAFILRNANLSMDNLISIAAKTLRDQGWHEDTNGTLDRMLSTAVPLQSYWNFNRKALRKYYKAHKNNWDLDDYSYDNW